MGMHPAPHPQPGGCPPAWSCPAPPLWACPGDGCRGPVFAGALQSGGSRGWPCPHAPWGCPGPFPGAHAPAECPAELWPWPCSPGQGSKDRGRRGLLCPGSKPRTTDGCRWCHEPGGGDAAQGRGVSTPRAAAPWCEWEKLQQRAPGRSSRPHEYQQGQGPPSEVLDSLSLIKSAQRGLSPSTLGARVQEK